VAVFPALAAQFLAVGGLALGTPRDSEKTRAKLIEAAGELFSQRGFKGVTVREIATKAETHLSALNYHFRSKEALYRQVLLEGCRADAISHGERNQLVRLDPEEALLLLIKEALREYSQEPSSNWRRLVVNRECREPSQAFKEVAEEYLRPAADFLARIIGKAVNKPADDFQVRFAMITMTGLLETFGLYGHLIEAVAEGLTEHMTKQDRLARDLTRLTIEAAGQSPER
jgi:AcrR family transcriptional regulator